MTLELVDDHRLGLADAGEQLVDALVEGPLADQLVERRHGSTRRAILRRDVEQRHGALAGARQIGVDSVQPHVAIAR